MLQSTCVHLHQPPFIKQYNRLTAHRPVNVAVDWIPCMHMHLQQTQLKQDRRLGVRAHIGIMLSSWTCPVPSQNDGQGSFGLQHMDYEQERRHTRPCLVTITAKTSKCQPHTHTLNYALLWDPPHTMMHTTTVAASVAW